MIKIKGKINNNIVLKKTKAQIPYCNFQLEILNKDCSVLPSTNIFFNVFKQLAEEFSAFNKNQIVVFEGEIKKYASEKYCFVIKKLHYPSNYFKELNKLNI